MEKKIINVRLLLLALLLVMTVACQDTNVFDPNAHKPGQEEVKKLANTFDFSTIQEVALTVDYSSYQTYGPVFFSVYNENPFVGEGDDQYLDESIRPLYENYTNKEGRFSQTVQMPAFASHLYIVTGNFFVTEPLMEADVLQGAAKAVAQKATRAVTRAAGATHDGTPTDDLTNMPFLSYELAQDGTPTNQIYNTWYTPLGKWDSKSGAPLYLLDKSTARSELVFTDDEMEGLYATVAQALNVNKPCREEYRIQEDLTLEKASEVTITMLGGSTCWNSTLGYYYYMSNEKPTSPADLNIIMLFPNTQDGLWKNYKPQYDYQGNIGVNRGDVIQLMYYPNIGNNGDETGATTIFPAGIKIGFILKTNGWAMQGMDYAIKGVTDADRKYNVWSSSTLNGSYCNPAPFGTAGKAPYQFTNPNGESRSAKFAYTTEEGGKYAIVSFEDACNDQDYDDVIFALKPISSFTPLPVIENNRTTTVGVYAFEDLWPSAGDYDMNDVVVDFKHEKVMSRNSKNEDFKIFQETFYLTTYQNYVTLKSGLAFTLDTKVTPASIVMMKKANNADEFEVAQFTTFNTTDGKTVYYLTDDVTAELGTTYMLELNYEKGLVEDNKTATIYPFIYREEANNMTWEVHIPLEAPTERMNRSYFGKDQDASFDNHFFVGSTEYPFAYFLYQADIEEFKNTILKRENESIKISDIYTDFIEWSVSLGTKKADWYLKPWQKSL